MKRGCDLLFVFPVDTSLPRGDSTHVREFLEHVMRGMLRCSSATYNDVTASSKWKRFWEFRWLVMRKYFCLSPKKVYIRYFPGIVIDLLVLTALRKKVIVELNAVLGEEATDLGRSKLVKFITRLDERVLCRLANAVVTVTPEIAEHYRRAYPKVTTAVVPNGVNTQLFDPERAKVPFDFSIGYQHFVVGFVGSLAPWQDIGTLLAAVEKLVKEHQLHDIRCVIVGTGSEECAIREQIISLALQKYVIMVGAKNYEAIPGYIKTFSIGVAPLRGTRIKSTGSAALKVYEYMAMGKPVVLTEVGSFSDMVQGRGVGLSYRGMDHLDLAAKIRTLYASPAENAAMGLRARELVQNEFSWAAAARATLQVIDSM